MPSPDVRIAQLAERQHAVFSRAQAGSCGLTQRQIEGRLACGLWRRVHRGVYAIRGAPSTFEGAVLAAVLSADATCASHTSAGVLWKLEGMVPAGVEVSVLNRKRRRPGGIIVHHPRTLRQADVTKIGQIPITTPVRTLIDLAGTLEMAALEDAVDDAIRRELIDPQKVLARLTRTSPYGRRGIPLLNALLAERAGKPATGSRLENVVRRTFAAAGLPPPIAQHEIRRPDGSFVARVDFAYPDARLAIEVDGYAYHSGRRRWEHDSIRQNRLVSLGWVPLRITSRQIRHHPQDVISLVWRHLATAQVGKRHQT